MESSHRLPRWPLRSLSPAAANGVKRRSGESVSRPNKPNLCIDWVTWPGPCQSIPGESCSWMLSFGRTWMGHLYSVSKAISSSLATWNEIEFNIKSIYSELMIKCWQACRAKITLFRFLPLSRNMSCFISWLEFNSWISFKSLSLLAADGKVTEGKIK